MLAELDRAMQGLALDAMATALVARLEQDEADLRAAVTAALVQRRAPAAGVLTADGAAPLLTTTAPTCCWASAPTPSAPTLRPSSTAGTPCCSTPTGWSSGATATSTRAPAR